MQPYFLTFLATLGATIVLTPLARVLLRRYGFMDRYEPHSTHRDPRPRGGGVVIALVFAVAVLVLLPWDLRLVGMLVGALVILIPNFIDDRTNGIPWWGRLLSELIGALIVVWSGVGISALSNPLSGEAVFLGPVISGVFTVVWILVAINAMNWLDGLDGLATGVGAIAALTLFGLALLPYVDQPSMATMAIALAGALAGFLVFNFAPATIKLGDAGSTFLGFVLSVLAIYASGKVATFFLVLGLPLLDVAWVIFRRVVLEKRSPFSGDRKHFHHRLLALGLKTPTVVLIFYGFSAVSGATALLVQGAQKKLLAIGLMTFTMILLATWVVWRTRRAELLSQDRQHIEKDAT